MKKLLLPIDGSARSLHTIDMVKKTFSPSQVEITILTVQPGQFHIDRHLERERLDRQAVHQMENYAALLPGYEIKTILLEGEPGPEIVHYAERNKSEILCMTRSSRGPLRKLGSVATYIVKHAAFLDLFIMREQDDS